MQAVTSFWPEKSMKDQHSAHFNSKTIMQQAKMPASFFVRKVKQHLGIIEDNYHLITFRDQDQIVTAYIRDLGIHIKPGVLILSIQLVSENGAESSVTLPIRMGKTLNSATKPAKHLELSFNNRINNTHSNRWSQYIQEYLWLTLFEVVQNMKSLFNIQAQAPLNAWYCDDGYIAMVFNATPTKIPLEDTHS